MQRYRRLSGESGVVAYDIGEREIAVEFVDGKVYTYSYASSGQAHVEQMKLLAQAGQGLCGYISKYVRDNYAVVREAGKVTRKQQPR